MPEYSDYTEQRLRDGRTVVTATASCEHRVAAVVPVGGRVPTMESRALNKTIAHVISLCRQCQSAWRKR